MPIVTSTRNAELSDLMDMLHRQQDLKLDAVVPATAIRSEGGNLIVSGMSVMGDDYTFRPTDICDAHIADKLGIPLTYLRTLRTTRPDLFDANVNGWLRGASVPGFDHGVPAMTHPEPDARSFLLRTFSDPDGGEGIARAMHSDRYAVIDNLDVLFAAMEGIRDAGVPVEFAGGDLSERRMSVRFSAPSVAALAPTLLAGYRSPFTGATGDENPTVFAGFELSNSETGGGSFSITPRLIVLVCNNGMKMTKDVFRKVHLGSKQSEGVVRYSDETRRLQMGLVTSEARDTVATFLDLDYVTTAIATLEAKSGAAVSDAVKTVEMVGKALHYTEDEQAAILDQFVRGGQMTAGGVMQAITATAQTVADPDRAYDLEATAVSAMELVAA